MTGELTPMMKQYMQTKEEYKDCLRRCSHSIKRAGNYSDWKELRTGRTGTDVRNPVPRS